MPPTDRRIDTYIEKAAPFAQPILKHLRALIHKAVPEIEETIKWSMPFFTVNGIVLAHMAAFKAHCAFGLWGEQITAKLKADGITPAEGGGGSMGSFGRITSLKDLPPAKTLIAYLRAGAAEIASGRRTVSYKRPQKRVAKPPLPIPPALAAVLKKNKKASAVFEGFPPSHRREYIQWVAEAKREETRIKRAAKAVEQLSQRKTLHWKYE